ncbi:zf-TFIIB domain-containing protein [Asticcacaulis sp. AC402]|uniref:TFIIB-type zinc ribbon-containing protein n=1 Tax=Asticcacaulis sp. AC402 TaxID=1282361 RepID=UPI0012DE13FA|nr:zf-TFIIB domain-containing protein [Asticcacaulis sp. AC402]
MLTAKPKPKRRCPDCTEALLETDYRQVRIDICPHCQGVWLDRGELEQIVEQALFGVMPRAHPRPSRRSTPEG